jgi:hypothetical protein
MHACPQARSGAADRYGPSSAPSQAKPWKSQAMEVAQRVGRRGSQARVRVRARACAEAKQSPTEMPTDDGASQHGRRMERATEGVYLVHA